MVDLKLRGNVLLMSDHAHQQEQIFSVNLALSHTEFASINFCRRFGTLPEYTVIEVDTAQFMACFERDGGMVIDAVEKWDSHRLKHVKDNLRPWNNGRYPEMPIADIRIKNSMHYPPILGWFKLGGKLIEQAVVCFTNGRHRARYMQYAGAASFPVEVHVDSAHLMRIICGKR